MNTQQKAKAAAMLEFFTDDLVTQGYSPEAALKRACEAVNRLIETTKEDTGNWYVYLNHQHRRDTLKPAIQAGFFVPVLK